MGVGNAAMTAEIQGPSAGACSVQIPRVAPTLTRLPGRGITGRMGGAYTWTRIGTARAYRSAASDPSRDLACALALRTALAVKLTRAATSRA